MRRRGEPKQIAKLVQVQHVRRAAADIALATARETEAQAAKRERDAHASAEAAAHDWTAFLSKPGFAPDYARSLAARVVFRAKTVAEAKTSHQIASDAHAQRQHDFRLSEALVKLTEASFDRARRDAGRAHEEKRLDELSGRITYRWMKA